MSDQIIEKTNLNHTHNGIAATSTPAAPHVPATTTLNGVSAKPTPLPDPNSWQARAETAAAADAARIKALAALEGQTDLLKEMAATSIGPLSRLSETLNVTLTQVSEWIAQPENRRHIFNLLGLLNAQTELLIAQQRVNAVIQLARLTQNESIGPETMRRACKDLLNIRLVERSRPAGRGWRGGDDLEPLPLPKAPKSQAQMMRDINWIMGKGTNDK